MPYLIQLSLWEQADIKNSIYGSSEDHTGEETGPVAHSQAWEWQEQGLSLQIPCPVLWSQDHGLPMRPICSLSLLCR